MTYAEQLFLTWSRRDDDEIAAFLKHCSTRTLRALFQLSKMPIKPTTDQAEFYKALKINADKCKLHFQSLIAIALAER